MANKHQLLRSPQQLHLIPLDGDDVVEVGEVPFGEVKDLLFAGRQPRQEPRKATGLLLGQELRQAAKQVGEHHALLLQVDLAGHRKPGVGVVLRPQP